MFFFNFSLFFALLVVICLLLCAIGGTFNNLPPKFISTMVLVLVIIAFIASFLIKDDKQSDNQENSDFYYLGAEILSIEGNEKGYLINFVPVDNPDYKNIKYTYIATTELDIDVPYLLTMDSKGTESIQDDEIVVVWKWVA